MTEIVEGVLVSGVVAVDFGDEVGVGVRGDVVVADDLEIGETSPDVLVEE